jgi:4-amino-4-deoxy-L-arabinose transferase-like glycosyltransferase
MLDFLWQFVERNEFNLSALRQRSCGPWQMKENSAQQVCGEQDRRLLDGGIFVLLGIVVAKLLIHLYASRNYGYFIDELYYMACGDHLDWGYVDQPPIVALTAKVARSLLGDSVPAIRVFSTLVGAAKVLLAAVMARELGGNRFAQILAALAVLVAPGFLAIDNLLSMNSFEALLWTGCAYVFVCIVRTGKQMLWILFGLLAGIGLENKHSMLIWGAAIVAGLLLTPQREFFRSPWLWISGLLAFLIFLPNLLWNYQHHFPFIELQENIRRSGRNASLTPLSFFAQEILSMNPVTLPIWLAGLWFFFFSEAGKPFRVLGWAFVFTACIILALDPRVYYLYPAYPTLFAAGGIVCESWLARSRLKWIKLGYPILLVIVGALLAPFAIPVLPVETYLEYSKALRFQQPAIENWKLGPLPQLYADQFGWQEMVATVAKVYNGLPADVRAKTAIFAQNYGQAGAVDFFGHRYGLPKAISGHQNYFFWGPREFTGESVIVMQGREAQLAEGFATVAKVATVYHPYSMPSEHFDVFYCQGLRWPLREVWPKLKHWD